MRSRHHQVPSKSPASNEKRKGRRGLAANWRLSHSDSFSPSGFHPKAPDWESTLPKTSACLSPTHAACNPPELAPAIRILDHHGDQRKNHPGRDQVIESSCHPPSVHVKTAVRKYKQAVRLFVNRKAMRRVNPNWTFIAEDFAGEFVTLHSAGRNFRTDDAPALRRGGG